MSKHLTVLDERHVWWQPMIAVATARGYDCKRILRGREAAGRTGLGFIRPHAVPEILEQNHADYEFMADTLTMIQDRAQVELYEDKSAQFWRFQQWMPPTWRFGDKDAALRFVQTYSGWLVSKADVGASSVNVRILKTRREQIDHVLALFGRGLPVNHCAGGPGGRNVTSTQRGYVLFQEFIPHEITYRVNAIGRGRAIFERYNATGTLTAQTGNVHGVTELDDTLTGLLAFADGVFAGIESKWCALDILKHGDRWVLIETSLAWPWPSPGDCMQAQFFGPTTHRWAQMWDLMLDEYEAGVWS